MITPLDIENKKFSKQMMNGYSVEEVDDFLDDLTVDYTKNYKEATELKAKVAELTKSLEHYKNIESTLQNTLVMAQKTADDVKNITVEVDSTQAEVVAKMPNSPLGCSTAEYTSPSGRQKPSVNNLKWWIKASISALASSRRGGANL